jgi:6-phosphogluconolactonase
MNVHCFSEKEASITALGEKIASVSAAALKRRPGFSLVLAGGSTPRDLYGLLARPPWQERIVWPQAHIFFGDERCVPPDHHDSNYRMVHQALLSTAPVPPAHIHRIHGEDDPEMAAAAYQRCIQATLPELSPGEPLFDIVLLGIGTDGHTASLFPDDAALQSSDLVTAVAAPRHMMPAVARISLTLRGIMQSRHICFLVHGKNKHEIVQAVLADDNSARYPAAMVQMHTVSWYLSGMDCTNLTNSPV